MSTEEKKQTDIEEVNGSEASTEHTPEMAEDTKPKADSPQEGETETQGGEEATQGGETDKPSYRERRFDKGGDDRKAFAMKRGRSFGRNRRRAEAPKSEFEVKVISARRVSRVVAGGRRFSLSVAVIAGNKKGKVGIGTGKGPDMAIAMDKAQNQAKKNARQIHLTDESGISHEVSGKWCASTVRMQPAKGFIAGGSVRTVADLAGIQNLNAKIVSRSKNHLNNARAAIVALQSLKN